MSAPVFYFDLSSPYSYLASERVDEVLPVEPVWQPIVFGGLLKQVGRVPWSFQPDRSADIAEIEWRAAARGLPPVTWPPGWPTETYSVPLVRAAAVAGDLGRIREFARAAYRMTFAEGRPPTTDEDIAEAARRAEVDPDAVLEAIRRQETKDRLRAATDEAVARGVVGIPTVAVGDRLFWGDDRLEEAAAALAGPLDET